MTGETVETAETAETAEQCVEHKCVEHMWRFKAIGWEAFAVPHTLQFQLVKDIATCVCSAQYMVLTAAHGTLGN